MIRIGLSCKLFIGRIPPSFWMKERGPRATPSRLTTTHFGAKGRKTRVGQHF